VNRLVGHLRHIPRVAYDYFMMGHPLTNLKNYLTDITNSTWLTFALFKV